MQGWLRPRVHEHGDGWKIPPFSHRKYIDSFMVDFPASHVSFSGGLRPQIDIIYIYIFFLISLATEKTNSSRKCEFFFGGLEIKLEPSCKMWFRI